MTTDTTKIAVLEANMTNIAKDISDIKEDVKAIIVQLNRQPSLEQEILQLKQELLAIKAGSSSWKIWSTVISVLVTSTITFLLMYFLQNIQVL